MAGAGFMTVVRTVLFLLYSFLHVTTGILTPMILHACVPAPLLDPHTLHLNFAGVYSRSHFKKTHVVELSWNQNLNRRKISPDSPWPAPRCACLLPNLRLEAWALLRALGPFRGILGTLKGTYKTYRRHYTGISGLSAQTKAPWFQPKTKVVILKFPAPRIASEINIIHAPGTL